MVVRPEALDTRTFYAYRSLEERDDTDPAAHFQRLGQPMPPDMNSQGIRALAEPMLGSLLAKQINRDDCFVANEAIMDARNLTGTDVGRLAVLAISIAERKGKGLAEILKICRLEPNGQ